MWHCQKLLLLSYLIALSVASGVISGAGSSGVAVDGLALLSFKSLVSDPLGALASWGNASLHFCQWRGVACGVYDGQPRVTSLDLESMDLAGPISPHLGNLSFLQRLHLPENELRGPMPPELSQLSLLQHLNLSFNPLGGEIPSFLFHNCSRLQNLSLNSNSFHGALPRNLSSCKDLRLLSLALNMLEGPIHGEIGSLSELQILNLQTNSLSGSIPPEIGNLALTQLTLSENRLTGELPTSLWNLSSLILLRLRDNMLSGSLPQSMGESLPNLQSLQLNDNQFHGRLPASLSNASNLFNIQLFNNAFSGPLPMSWGALQSLENVALSYNQLEARTTEEWEFISAWTNCTSLQLLDLGINNLGEKLPGSLANLSTTLEFIALDYNYVAGSIPSEIGNLNNLAKFFINSNFLTGDIPVTVGKISRMVELKLGDNALNGEIPASLGNLSQLSNLSVSHNELRGSLPLSLGDCTSLRWLDLGFNMLTGEVPGKILQIPTLTFLDVQHNSLTGPLPPEVGSLLNIEEIHISGNAFSGTIPGSLGGCLHLERLLASGNMFQGPIPSSLSQLKGLQEFDLSRNNFTGRIPGFLTSIPFSSYLNLSFNNFDGEVPRDGVFTNASLFSVLGNSKLCGGVPALRLPPCQNSSSKKHSTRILIMLLAAGGVCTILFFVVVAFLLFCKSEKQIHGTMGTGIKDRYAKMTYAELLRATNGFSKENFIGAGSFGSVYRGQMGDVAMAVKVFNLQQRGASRSFFAECTALQNIRHRNLVSVITACSSTDFTGNAFKALIYEFMPNGSLESWLHPQTDDRRLSLVHRLYISIDVATAVDYLHNRHGQTPIVHSDLKPSNVLLDDDMMAHVGDFGLARFANKFSGSSSSQKSSSSISTTFKGTIGYIAPEYGVGNKVSAEGDVYSCGMLLLEMFTGRRPTDEMFTGGLSLHGYVKAALSDERVAEVVDPNMFLEKEERETISVAVLDCLRSVLEIGISCSKETPAERMKIEDAVDELTAARDALIEQI